jgi:aspartate beta-hydroxylase
VTTAEGLERARRLVADHRLDEAADAWRAARELAPAEAAAFLGDYAVHRGAWKEAVAELEAATRLAPADLDTLEKFGLACERAGALDRAGDALRRVLDANPARTAARLVLGFVEHRLGHELDALVHMQWAFRQARERGDWKDLRAVPSWLADHVRGAGAFIARHLPERLQRGLRDADGDTSRVQAFIRGQLRLERLTPQDPRQAPKKHFLPGLPASPWHDLALFPWAQRLKEAFPDILAEYLAVAGGTGGFEPFLDFKSAEQAARYLGTTGPVPEWNAFFFYRHGERNEENCRRCPKTAALLDSLPLIHLPATTPEICFSVLTPGSHILPHRGDSNLRSVVHLGLVIPPECVLKVAGEERSWQPGELLAFDDTYEHEAWNRSGSTRAVLLMDAWNPYLTDVERKVLPQVFGSMNEIATATERLRPRTL